METGILSIYPYLLLGFNWMGLVILTFWLEYYKDKLTDKYRAVTLTITTMLSILLSVAISRDVHMAFSIAHTIAIMMWCVPPILGILELTRPPTGRYIVFFNMGYVICISIVIYQVIIPGVL